MMLTGKRKMLEKNLSQYHFIYHKSHVELPGREPESPRKKVGNNHLCYDTVQNVPYASCLWYNAIFKNVFCV
jgi:hypothetical protein